MKTIKKNQIQSDCFPVPQGWIGTVERNSQIISIILGISRKTVLKDLKKTLVSFKITRMPGCRRQIRDYLEGRSRKVSLEFRLENMTPLQKKILIKTMKIPYGKTLSYSKLAGRAGNPHLARVVGTTMARNPLPLLIPCHRVVKADGTIGGFMGRRQDRTGWKTSLLHSESMKAGNRKMN